MQVGDLVRFKDISSACDNGHRLFPEFEGKLAIVIERSTCPSGNAMATVLFSQTIEAEFGGSTNKERFNIRYFEVG